MSNSSPPIRYRVTALPSIDERRAAPTIAGVQPTSVSNANPATLVITGTGFASGAVVIDHVTIGSRSVVGAGAVVVADVPDRVQVLGVPARIVKEGIDGR